jgi:hypothetical protein
MTFQTQREARGEGRLGQEMMTVHERQKFLRRSSSPLAASIPGEIFRIYAWEYNVWHRGRCLLGIAISLAEMHNLLSACQMFENEFVCPLLSSERRRIHFLFRILSFLSGRIIYSD